jgi:PAS domain S-box-containing protein
LDWPLRAKLTALLILASVVPLATVALLDIREARQRLYSNTAALLAARGDQLVGELDAFQRGYLNSVRRSARLPPVHDLFRSAEGATEEQKATVRALLLVQPETDPRVRGAGLLDANGRVIVATEPALVGQTLAFHGYVREALRGGGVVSEVHFAGPEVARTPTIAFVEPVLGVDGKVVGLFALWVKASALWEIMKASNALAGPGSFAVLLDSRGVRIAHTHGQAIVFRPAGVLEPSTIEAWSQEQRFGEGTRSLLEDVRPFPEQFARARAKSPDRAMFRGFAPVTEQWIYGVGRRLQTVPWTAFYVVPESHLTQEIAEMTARRSWFAAGTIGAALFVGALFTALLLRPINALSAATRSLSNGDLASRVRSPRKDEIGRLAASFDAMAERIQAQAEALREANRDLERKVLERTRALAETTLALQESEESLAITIQSIGDGVIATDTTGHVTRMNTVAEELSGWSLGDAVGKPVSEVFRIQNEETRKPAESPVDRVLREGKIIGLANHTVLVARDGTSRAIADSAAPIRDAAGVLRGVVLVFSDQTEQRKAEKTLRDSEARKSAILEAALDSIVTMDRLGRITEFNPAAERTFGRARERVLGQLLSDLLIPEALRERHSRGLERYLQTGVGPVLGRRVEVEALRADGTVFPVELAVVATEAEEGPTFTAYIRDISARLEAERALHVSEARFRHLTESGIIGILVSDLAGNIEDANDEFLRIIGYSREDLGLGKVRLPEMTPDEWRSADAAAREQFQSTGKLRPREKEYVRKDGSRVPVLVGAAMLDAPRCIAFVLDLSEQKRAEEVGALAVAAAEEQSVHRVRAEEALRNTEHQLRQSQKMEAVGTLAGGIAHDFNNLLSVILSYSEMLIQDLSPADPMRAELEQISRAGKRAHELTRQLLVFSRRQVLKPKILNLNDAISSMTSMLRRLIGEDIELLLLPAANLGSVHVDPTQMEQVLLNLVVNARDAMQRGGKLTIETGNVELDGGYATEHLGAEPGSYVMLSVSDTGVGMSRETQSRIFEPFFTTKETGKGTGLGLSTVFGIVKQSGGSVWVYSELARGTTFKIYLPRTDARPEPSDSAETAPTVGGTETILLVEDDEQVRTLASSILRKNGYRVLEASGGGDALLICEQYPLPIHVMLSDVVMPRMSGREVWERLSPMRPNMKILFMSGYTDDGIVHHGVLSSEFAFVQKPLMPSQLLAQLRIVIDKGRAG